MFFIRDTADSRCMRLLVELSHKFKHRFVDLLGMCAAQEVLTTLNDFQLSIRRASEHLNLLLRIWHGEYSVFAALS